MRIIASKIDVLRKRPAIQRRMRPVRRELHMIRQCAANGLNLEQVSFGARCRLWLALKSMAQTVGEDRSGLQALCQHIVRTTPCAQRYDIMNLCLRVMGARNSVNQQELTFIRQLTAWFQLDPEHIRAMIEKVLPIGLFEELDAPTFLGITSDMPQEQVRKHLNREYAKWNARVTHTDADIQNQAEQMLDLIAHTRSQYLRRSKIEVKLPEKNPDTSYDEMAQRKLFRPQLTDENNRTC